MLLWHSCYDFDQLGSMGEAVAQGSLHTCRAQLLAGALFLTAAHPSQQAAHI